jgi:TRAP-type C4-dicarboxylate transport system permease small subunit
MSNLTTIGRAIWRSLDWFSTHLGWITGGLTAIMTIAVMREVVGRYLFRSPTDWSVEVSCYLVVILGYLALPYTELQNKHIRIEFIHEHFRGKIKHAVDIFIHLSGIVWSGVLVWQGFVQAWDSFVTKARSETILEWPLFPFHAMVPLGAFLLCLVLLGRVVRSVNLLVKGKGP